MKKYFLLILLILSFKNSKGQWNDTNLPYWSLIYFDCRVYEEIRVQGGKRFNPELEVWEKNIPDSLYYVAGRGNILISSSVWGNSIQGYWISKDNGALWIKMNNDTMHTIFIYKDVLFGVNNNKLYKSSDYGNVWKEINEIRLPNYIIDVNDVLFLLTPEGIYKSIDEGIKWELCNNGILKNDWNPSWIGESRLFTNGTSIYFQNMNDGIYMSGDDGLNWKKISSPISRLSCIAPYKNDIYASGYHFGPYGHEKYRGIFKLSEGDSTWSILNKDTTIACESLVASKGYLYAGFKGSVFRQKIDDFDLNSLKFEIKNEKGILIFPNPFNGLFNIQSEDEQILGINIYSELGNLVLAEESIENNYLTIDLSENSKGIFFLHVKFKDRIVVKKLFHH